MTSKTPQFDKALDAVLNALTPHERTCGWCGQRFPVEKEDIDFYRMLRVPPPTLCPVCRQQRRRAFVNYTTFYKRDCSVPGHKEKLISQIPANSTFPVYDADYYWSGEWDPFSYGFPYSERRGFFEQFKGLLDTVPQPATTRDPMSVNSEYTAAGIQLKNCYYVFGGLHPENVLYANWPVSTKDSIDILVSWECERCYEVVEADHCFACQFIYFSKHCMESRFLYDCQNCDHCFGCINLRNKKYYFFNQPLTKEEYEEKIREIDLGDREVLEHWKDRFLASLKGSPKRITFNTRTTNSTGSLLEDCDDCQHCFFIKGGKHNRYAEVNLASKDCMDMLLGTSPSRCYESVTPYDGSDLRFVSNLRGECIELEYSINVKNCSYCFGCICLENKKYCIFNTQYPEEEYWPTVDRIKTRMLEQKEYGEFFPTRFSMFPYNASLAQISSPYRKEEAEKRQLWWSEPELSEFPGEVFPKEKVPKRIEDVPDSLVNAALRCEVTGKPFRITKTEFAFYRKEHLPIPTIHPSQRLLNRFLWIGAFVLTETSCVKCGEKVVGNVSLGITDNIRCLSCYLKEVV